MAGKLGLLGRFPISMDVFLALYLVEMQSCESVYPYFATSTFLGLVKSKFGQARSFQPRFPFPDRGVPIAQTRCLALPYLTYAVTYRTRDSEACCFQSRSPDLSSQQDWRQRPGHFPPINLKCLHEHLFALLRLQIRRVHHQDSQITGNREVP
jgi:hypothetical protein